MKTPNNNPKSTPNPPIILGVVITGQTRKNYGTFTFTDEDRKALSNIEPGDINFNSWGVDGP